MKREYRVTNRSGMGGAFNPPGHPEHTHHVECDLRRRPENRGGMSLSYALTLDYVDDQTKAEIMVLLQEWDNKKLPSNHPNSISWIVSVVNRMGTINGERFIKTFYPEIQNTLIP